MHTIFPHLAFIIQSIGPERSLHLFAAKWEPKPNEVVEVPVGHSFNVEENRGAVERWRWGSDDMNLFLLDRQGFEFVVVPDERSALARFLRTLSVRSGALSPSGAVAV